MAKVEVQEIIREVPVIQTVEKIVEVVHQQERQVRALSIQLCQVRRAHVSIQTYTLQASLTQ